MKTFTSKAGASGRRRGFSLIEVAIALAVAGILLGGMLVPVGNELSRKAYIKTHAQVADAIEAIVGYAAASRSHGMLIGYANGYDVDGDESVRAYFGAQFSYVPPGRPYLPCPDIDNDGLEDRYGTDSTKPKGFLEQAATLNPDSFSVLDYYGAGAGGRNRLPVYFEISRLSDISISFPVFGECKLHFGNLPWKTLLLPAADAWGSMFTYVVHPNLSTAGFGFDQHTRTSVFPLYSRPDLESSAAGGAGDQLAPIIGAGARARTPILVCDYWEATNYLEDNPTSNDQLYAPCSTPHTEIDALFVPPAENFGGSLTNARNRFYGFYDLSTEVFDDVSPYPLARANYVGHVSAPTYNTITDGIAFAVISHGQDRGGARRVSDGACTPLLGDDDEVDELLRVPAVHAQKQNALYGSCEDELKRAGGTRAKIRRDPRGFSWRAGDLGHGEFSLDKSFSNIGSKVTFDFLLSEGVEAASQVDPRDIFGAVVAAGRGGHAPPGLLQVPSFASGRGVATFDDIVGWLTRRELFDRLHDAGVFPVAYHPGLLAEGMPAELSGL